MHAFRDLETAAYCPRKLYYRRREGTLEIPDEVETVRSLAFEYDRLLADDAALLAAPIEPDPSTYRSRLDGARDRIDAWPALVAPPERDVHLVGREARGVAHKVLEDPLAPALAFAGRPPEEGVWEPQTVRLVAAAKALSWERQQPVEVAFAEYPAHGVVRPMELTVRRRAAYRRAVRTAASVDGPPARLDDEAKCEPCEYRDTCGTRTRSLKTMLSP
jgi:CRISPR-associated exonuclease Cas4